MDPSLLSLAIVVIDDDRDAAERIEKILRDGGFTDVLTVPDPTLAVSVVAAQQPDLVLLGLHTVERSGFALMSDLGRMTCAGIAAPVIVVAKDQRRETVRRALTYGAVDFVGWPLDGTELVLRVRNHLKLRLVALLLDDQLHGAQADLERERLEALERLAGVAEARDQTMGEHLLRVEQLTAAIAGQLGWSVAECQQVGRASRVHDIGMIAIPDAVMLKPGPLDEREQELMRTHTTVGAGLLAGSRSPLLLAAERIARAHHERWDGLGYPNGLRGEQISIEARIVAVADAFDALTTNRVHRPAGTVESAIEAITAGRGSQFDPATVDAFTQIADHSPPRSYEIASSNLRLNDTHRSLELQGA
jgi:putative two-component system response regulator